MTEATDVLAPFVRRAMGLAVDSVVAAVPVGLVALAVAPGGVGTASLALLVLLQLATVIAYQSVLVARSGRTVGHRILRIAVVRRDDGGRVTPRAALARAVLPAVVALVPFVGAALTVIVYARALFHPLNQGLHDAVAGTVVVMR